MKLEPGTKNKVDPLQFQYRTVVRHHILQTRCPGVSIAAEQEDVFEKEAKHFPPVSLINGFQRNSTTVLMGSFCSFNMLLWHFPP
jgi:hypothetical protein